MQKLTPRYKRFVEEYLVDLDGTNAAIRAGYSAKSAASKGSQLLTIVNIKTAIAEAKDKRSERTEITQDMVVQELARLAFTDMADYTTWGPLGVRMIASERLPKGATRAVSEVSETITKEGSTVKFKLHDKKGSLELLGKHLGMFSDKYEDHSTNILINGDDPQIVIARIFATMSGRVDGSSNGHTNPDGVPEDASLPENGAGGSS